MTEPFVYRYLEHSQLQIPKALPPVAEALNANLTGAAAASRGPTVSDKEWKTLLGKLVGLLNTAFCLCSICIRLYHGALTLPAPLVSFLT